MGRFFFSRNVSNWILFIRSAVVVLVVAYLASLIARAVFLPFSNPEEIVGPLTRLKFNPTNNLIRYFIFVTLPAVAYLVVNYRGFFGQKLTEIDVDINVSQNGRPVKWLFIFAQIALLTWSFFGFLNFFAQPLSPRALDFYHDGESLTPGLNYVLTGKLWTGSLMVHGAIEDGLTAVWGWRLFGYETVGAYFTMFHLLASLIPLGVGFFVFTLGLWAKYRFGFFAAAGLISVMVLGYVYSDAWQYLDRRDFPVLVGLGLTILAITFEGPSIWLFSGFFSPIAFFYSIDRGGYYLLICTCVLAAPILIARLNAKWLKASVLPWIVGCLLGWAGLTLIFGTAELHAFLTTTLGWVKWKDYIDSYVYPDFRFANLRHTFPVILVSINLLGFAVMLPRYFRAKDVSSVSIHVIMAVAGFLYYRSALGRSDEGHLRYASTFVFLGFSYLVWRISLFLPSVAKYTAICVTVLITFWFSSGAARTVFDGRHAVAAFLDRMNQFVSLPDDAFLNPDQKSWLRVLDSQLKDEKCLFSFTNDNVVNYLLKKPSCSRFFAVITASSLTLQREVVSDLKLEKPRMIIYSSPTGAQAIDGIQNSERLPLVNDYILKYYQPAFDEAGWKFFRRVEST